MLNIRLSLARRGVACFFMLALVMGMGLQAGNVQARVSLSGLQADIEELQDDVADLDGRVEFLENNDASCTVNDDGVGSVTISCPDGTGVTLTVPYCGDGIVDPGEVCDNPSDSNCVDCTALCGNSIVEGDEICDDPSDANCVNCEAYCGNNVVEGDEECDDATDPYCIGCRVASNLNFPLSEIIDDADAVRINSWAGTSNQEWELCYRRSRDGGNASAFHSRCDGRGATVMVALLNGGTSIERKVGGYAVSQWNGSGYTGNSTNFLFSLTYNYKHTWYRYGYYQYNNPNYGPTWGGGHDFYTNLASSSYCNIGHSYRCRTGGYGSSTCRNDFCGTYRPTITELEVWYKK